MANFELYTDWLNTVAMQAVRILYVYRQTHQGVFVCFPTEPKTNPDCRNVEYKISKCSDYFAIIRTQVVLFYIIKRL